MHLIKPSPSAMQKVIFLIQLLSISFSVLPVAANPPRGSTIHLFTHNKLSHQLNRVFQLASQRSNRLHNRAVPVASAAAAAAPAAKPKSTTNKPVTSPVPDTHVSRDPVSSPFRAKKPCQNNMNGFECASDPTLITQCFNSVPVGSFPCAGGATCFTTSRLVKSPENPVPSKNITKPSPAVPTRPAVPSPLLQIYVPPSTTSTKPTTDPIRIPPRGGFCSSSPSPVKLGYITAWSQFRSGSCKLDITKINTSKWDYLLYSFGTITNSKVSLSSDDVTYINQIKSAGFKIILSLGGWGYDTLFPPIASSSSNMKIFSDSLIDLIQKYGIDGVDIDWEYPRSYLDANGKVIPASDGENLGKWLIQLRGAIGKDKIISMAVPMGSVINNYPLTIMASQIDYLNV
ncbi:hypothetical protein HDU97_006054, partial [Phlyctochytrium planicorne]